MKNLRICYFGAYNSEYPRNHILRKGLQLNGVDIVECAIPADVQLWKRNFALLGKYIKSSHHFDAIVVAETNQFVVPLAKCLSIVTGTPLIFDVFFSLYDSYVKDRQTVKEHSVKAGLFSWIDRFSMMLSDVVIADTRQHRQYYHERFNIPADKIDIVYIGYDDELFQPRRSRLEQGEPSPFTVVFTGSFIPLHGIDYILKAAKILEEHQDIRFEFAGAGQTYKAMLSLADNLGLENCVFSGPVPLLQIPELLANADICLGIFGETEKTTRVIPNKVYEGLAMKKPVLTGDSPAIREVFHDQEHLLVCNCADEHSLADAIVKLKRDDLLRTNIAEAGYQAVRERFTPQALGKQLKDILVSLL